MPRSNKMPLDHHRTNFNAYENSMVRLQKQLEDLQHDIAKIQNTKDLLGRQIREAERTGRTEFDEDRFLIPVKKTTNPAP